MNWLTFIKRVSKKPSRETAKSLDLRLLSRSRPLSQAILDCTQVLTDRAELLSRLPKKGVVAEIGVANGDFSEKILKINSPRKLFLIDAWHMAGKSSYGESGFSEVQSRFCDAIQNGSVEILRGWSHEKIAEIKDASLDWAYIDAGHDFDSVKRDLDLVKTKLKPDGVICGHDYVRWGRFGQRFGVVEAVNEFIYDNDFLLAYITVEPNYNPSFAIMRRAT